MTARETVQQVTDVPRAERFAAGPRRALVARAVTLPIGGLAGLATTLLVLRHSGISHFALFSLVVTLPALLPFSDLGVGAAVSNMVAGRGNVDPAEADGVLLTSVRTLVGLGAVIVAVATVVGLAGAWPTLLGLNAPHVGAAVTVAMSCFGASLAAGIGSPVLRGDGRNHVVIVVQGGISVIGLVLVLAWTTVDLPSGFLLVLPFVALFLGALLQLFLAQRWVGIDLINAYRRLLSGPRGVSIRNTAWPMAVIAAAVPIGYNTDRLVLSHAGGAMLVAVYSLAAQLFSQAQGLVGAAGGSLWAVFAHERAAGSATMPRTLWRLTSRFGALGLLLGLGLMSLGPWAVDLLSGGRLHAGVGLMAAFGAVVFVLGLTYPAGMYMTDAAGLRFQAASACSMVGANLGLSIWWAPILGPVGPVLGTLVSVSVFMATPMLLSARRRTRLAACARLERPQGSAASVPEPTSAKGVAFTEPRSVPAPRHGQSRQGQEPILVTGLIRGGTTWPGSCLATAPRTSYIHEPFNPGTALSLPRRMDLWFTRVDTVNAHVYRKDLEAAAALRQPLFGPNGIELRESLDAAIQAPSYALARVRKDRVIVKDPIAVMSADWLSSALGWRVVQCMRHPAAFVSSIKRLNWSFDFQDWLDQPRLMDDLLAPFRAEVERAAASSLDLIDQGVLQWRALAHVVDRHLSMNPTAIAVRHEVIAAAPERHLPVVFADLGLTWNAGVERRLESMTSTGSRGEVPIAQAMSVHRVASDTIQSWTSRLSTEDVRRIRGGVDDIVERFYPSASWTVNWQPEWERPSWRLDREDEKV